MSKSWIYTLNNYTDQDIEQFKSFTCNRHRCCKEIGANGTPHLQGAITFTRSYSLIQLKKLSRAHWEIAKARDAENYCTKGDIIIDINNRQQGRRTDIELLAEACKEGINNVINKYPAMYIKLHTGIGKLTSHYNKSPNWRNVEVDVFWGDAGCGKTKKAFEIDPDLYRVPVPDGKIWFDGYTDQKTILLDDFYGWIKYHELLHMLDGYPIQYQVKGGFTWAHWTRVIITSNKHPNEWYEMGLTPALERRLTSISKLKLTEVPIGNTIIGTSKEPATERSDGADVCNTAL